MKRLSIILISVLVLLFWSCEKDTGGGSTPEPTPVDPVRTGESGITYQLLVYSFADSNGDGIGDFNGISSKLDYLKEMGVQALWLSPIHPATSYHGYDVEDYSSVNPEYGTEADFTNLLSAAHSKGIKVYLDFVLNHTSKEHSWFLDATSSPDSQYYDWYMLSQDPASDVKAGKFPMMSTTSYNASEWSLKAGGVSGPQNIKFTLTVDKNNKPLTITASEADNISNTGTAGTGIYLYYGDGQMAEFNSDLTLSLNIESAWGILVRTSTDSSWPVGTKWGGKKGENTLQWDTPLNLYPSTSSFDPTDVLLPGMVQLYYYSFFGSYMPDINYGSASTCENSASFKALCDAADKWIRMGVDGFRLDAVKHIYNNSTSDENPTFLQKFYDHCNATFKTSGHTGDIYMVGEHFSEAPQVAPYYSGLPAFFEFSFWWRLIECINNGKGNSFISTLRSYRDLYAQYRPNFIEATKLSNHDEDRAGETLGRNQDKMKFAGAVLLTCCGEPYIYQGEELGYYGSKSRGDEYVRTPIMWTTSTSSMASAKVNVDQSMMTPSISVEAQSGDDNSVLSCYRKFGVLRDKYPALAKGNITTCSFPNAGEGMGCWKMEYNGQTVLVIHNFGGQKTIDISSAGNGTLIASIGKVTHNGSNLTIGQFSSAIFILQ